ncbi:MAG: hypothetical protein M1829_000411 [Trizodia sp. TS-e1964]|nr:MAG: hypothetical protein M1829_000411 [Trizodia sp. TS-e1964]
MSTTSIPAALSAHIYYNAEFNILCCKDAACLHALEPKSAARHYAEEHHFSLALRKTIANYIQANEEFSCRNNQVQPPNGLQPQPFLQIHHDLYQCKRCLLVKSHPKSIRQHINAAHMLKNFALGEESNRVAAQTWYPGTKAVWWQVEEAITSQSEVGTRMPSRSRTPASGQNVENTLRLPILSSPQSKMLAKMAKDEKWQVEQEERQRLYLAEAHNADRLSPWLNMTGWLDVFSIIPQPLSKLARLIRTPAKEEIGLQLLGEIFTDFIVPRCMETLKNAPHPYLTWLASPQESVDQAKPFTQLQANSSLRKCMRFWVQYICYIIRSLLAEKALIEDPETDSDDDSDEEDPQLAQASMKEALVLKSGLHLTREQHTLICRIHLLAARVAPLRFSDLDEAVKQQVGAELLRFLTLSIRQQLHLQLPYKSSPMHFLAHMGIDATQNALRTSMHYTGILAGVLYISRLLILEYSLSVTGWPAIGISAFSAQQTPDHKLVSEETPVEDSCMKRFQLERCNWLVQGKNTPISTLLRQLAYGKMLNRIEGTRATVTWNLSLTRLYFKEHPIDIGEFKTAVKKIIADATEVLNKLLLGVQGKRHLDKIHDTISNSGLWGTTGFNFTRHPVN